MSALDLDAIRARANAATPGPWTAVPGLDSMRMPETVRRHWFDEKGRHCTSFICGHVNEAEDAAFIAALSPDVALALIAEIESLRVAVARVEALRSPCRLAYGCLLDGVNGRVGSWHDLRCQAYNEAVNDIDDALIAPERKADTNE